MFRESILLQHLSFYSHWTLKPLDMHPRWFGMSAAYIIAKYNMSMCALGHADEFKDEIAGNGFSGFFNSRILVNTNAKN